MYLRILLYLENRIYSLLIQIRRWNLNALFRATCGKLSVENKFSTTAQWRHGSSSEASFD
jgi:hypothetical protein